MMFRNISLILSLVGTTVSAQSCSDSPPPCKNAECIVLHNDPFFVCDCLPGYIPTGDHTICVPGQAYDHGGANGDFNLCDDAHCDPDSTCNQDSGYVSCVCPDDRSVHQGVECDTNSGFDWDEDVGEANDPCSVDNNLCDHRSVCMPRDTDATLAECHCNNGLVLYPGFACPGEHMSDVADPCSNSVCEPDATCRPASGGLAECVCPSGGIVRPFYPCPGIASGNLRGEPPIPVGPALPPPPTSVECSPMVNCRDGSACTIIDGRPMCECPGNMGLLIEPNIGTCEDLCLSNSKNPCGLNATCEMVHGWAQCSCGYGLILQHENC